MFILLLIWFSINKNKSCLDSNYNFIELYDDDKKLTDSEKDEKSKLCKYKNVLKNELVVILF